MARFSFAILENPVPKGRPRLGRGNSTRTPQKTRTYERTVAWRSKGAWNYEGHNEPLGGIPISISLKFYMKRPKRITSKTVGGCDLDNLVKSVLDGMQGVIFADDRQITKIAAEKHYAAPSDHPYTYVELEW